jgi:hypothetical protein
MIARVSAVHTAAVGMKNIRFFAAPEGKEGGMPWVSVDDLFAALSMPRKVRLGFKKDLRSSDDWKGVMHSVLTDQGRVDIFPNWAAGAFIGAAQEHYQEPIQTQIIYANGLMAAFDKVDPLAGKEGFTKALIFEIHEKKPGPK